MFVPPCSAPSPSSALANCSNEGSAARQNSQESPAVARFSARTLFKGSLVAATLLNAGAITWIMHNASKSLRNSMTPGPRRMRPQIEYFPSSLTQSTRGVVERYRDDHAFRALLEQVQALEAASLPAGTKSVGELNHAVLSNSEVKIKPKDKVVLFAMFTTNGTVSTHTRFYVESLKAKFDHVIGIIATDAEPESLTETPVADLFSVVVARENLGLDFPGWALAMRLWPNVWDAAQLICTNDSVFGPLEPEAFAKMLRQIDTSPGDFIGLTESLVGLDAALHERGTSLDWHYQSYFFALKNRALRNFGVQSFWFDQVFALADKAEVIRRYELGMSFKMKALGMKTEALFSRVPSKSLENPVISACKELLEIGFPFIKRELFRSADLLPFLLRVDLAGAAQAYPLALPPLPEGSCDTVRHNATLAPLGESLVELPFGGAIDAINWTSPHTLRIRGWSAAETLRVAIEPAFALLQINTQWRMDVISATGEAARGCSGFVMDLTSQAEFAAPVDKLKLCIVGETASGNVTSLDNPFTPECDEAALPPFNASRLSLRYQACGGMCNQIYSHLSAWSLGHALGAEVELAPALTRNTFGDYDMPAEKNRQAHQVVKWDKMPLGSLLDIKHLAIYGRRHGLRLRAGKPAHLDTAPRLDVPRYHQLTLPALVRNVTSRLNQKADALEFDPAEGPKLTLQLPCSFLAVANLHTDPFVVDMVRFLRLSPHLRGLAKQVVRSMAPSGNGAYNGIHLRLERDATHAVSLYGGQTSYEDAYLQGVADAHFDDTLPIYISSGLLSYGDDTKLRAFKQNLTEAGHRARITYKEQHLGKADLAGLAPEQQAALDFEVLAGAEQVVGIAWSSFSYFLREYRTLHGFAPEQTVLAGRPFFPESYFRIAP